MSSKDLLLQLLEEKLMKGGCDCDIVGEGRRRRRTRRTRRPRGYGIVGGKSAAKVAQGRKLAKYNKLVASGYSKKDAKEMSGLGITGGASDLDKLDRIKAIKYLKELEKFEKRGNVYADMYDGICQIRDKYGEYIEDPITGDCGHYSKIYKKYGRNPDSFYNAFEGQEDSDYAKSRAEMRKKKIDADKELNRGATRAKLARKLGFKPSITKEELDKLLGN